MADLLVDQFERLRASVDQSGSDIPATVDAILQSARDAGATDIHLVPLADALRMDWRIDGVLHRIADFPAADAPRLTARLKVIAGLLTYRTDVPQEGRIAGDQETRVSTFPTLFGEKAVVRLFAEAGRYEWIEQLGLPEDIQQRLRPMLDETSGVLMFAGPAGSGKTTTIYSCLREIVASTAGARSVVSIEDPVEVVVPGVSQSQVNATAGFDLAAALRAMMRQDPEVIMVGEIRDRETAEAVFQAALTGHLVLTTFHAGSAVGAVSRLLDMGIEPYVLRSTVKAVLAQRLLRRLCSCAGAKPPSDDGGQQPAGCPECKDTGYRGRMPIAEMLVPDEDPETSRAILSRTDTARLHSIALASGMLSQRARADEAVQAGLTSRGEMFRIFGGEAE